jgi:hypothetical protein
MLDPVVTTEVNIPAYPPLLLPFCSFLATGVVPTVAEDVIVIAFPEDASADTQITSTELSGGVNDAEVISTLLFGVPVNLIGELASIEIELPPDAANGTSKLGLRNPNSKTRTK